jgi:hypothetical protein
VDYVGIAKAAAAESDAKTGVIVGGAIGGLIALVALSFVAFKINQRYEAHLRRANYRGRRNSDVSSYYASAPTTETKPRSWLSIQQ